MQTAKVAKTDVATKLKKTTKTAVVAIFGQNLFNASSTGPLVKGAQVFRLRKKTAKERPARRHSN